jgi:hypothetical protein
LHHASDLTALGRKRCPQLFWPIGHFFDGNAQDDFTADNREREAGMPAAIKIAIACILPIYGQWK